MTALTAASLRELGKEAESIAASFLEQNGYTILERNFYYQHGEIDIVARDGSILVFVEVKMRRSTRFGAPEESVTPKKQELLRRTAEGYVQVKNIGAVECRFDVVSIVLKNGAAECNIFRDCF